MCKVQNLPGGEENQYKKKRGHHATANKNDGARFITKGKKTTIRMAVHAPEQKVFTYRKSATSPSRYHLLTSCDHLSCLICIKYMLIHPYIYLSPLKNYRYYR